MKGFSPENLADLPWPERCATNQTCSSWNINATKKTKQKTARNKHLSHAELNEYISVDAGRHQSQGVCKWCARTETYSAVGGLTKFNRDGIPSTWLNHGRHIKRGVEKCVGPRWIEPCCRVHTGAVEVQVSPPLSTEVRSRSEHLYAWWEVEFSAQSDTRTSHVAHTDPTSVEPIYTVDLRHNTYGTSCPLSTRWQHDADPSLKRNLIVVCVCVCTRVSTWLCECVCTRDFCVRSIRA